MDPRIIEKFWNNVEKTKFCWNWLGELSSGLPIVRVRINKKLLVHSARKVSLFIIGKQSPNPKQSVQPLICQNQMCVNPDHLVAGDEARFWAKVCKLSEANGGCWTWIGGMDGRGYGHFSLTDSGKKIDIKAHQYSWQLYMGRPLPRKIGLFVCHKCDHRYCVNPDHLFIGEAQDNMTDKMQKGRHVSSPGEKNGMSKLTEEKVREIRKLYPSFSSYKLAKMYGVSQSIIMDIIHYRKWKHVI
jgi:hypothetical protein